MIKDFEKACPNVEEKIARIAERVTDKHNRRVANQMAVCEDILAVMSAQPMRVMEICNCYADNERAYRNHRYSCQKVSAMLKKLIVLGLVERVLIEEIEIPVETYGYWGYRPEDYVTVDGQQYVKAGAKQVWIDGEPIMVKTKIYGFVKIGA